jgi:hypothetical protein
MEEYTFDSDKVRRIAKRSSLHGFARRGVKFMPLAAAAVAFAAGIFAVSAIFAGILKNSGDGISYVAPASDTVSRLSAAETALVESQKSKSVESKTLFLSFGESMTFHEMQNVFDYVSDTGNIKVEAIYLLDDNDEIICVFDPAEIETVKRDKKARIVGAKIKAPENLVEDLNSQQEIMVIEPETAKLNDESFVPLSLADVADFNNSGDRSADVTTPDGFDAGVTYAPETAAAVETPYEGGSRETDFENYPDEPGESVGETEEEPPVSSVEQPNTVPLDSFIEPGVGGVIEADFISDYGFVAITADSARLYAIEKGGENSDFSVYSVAEFAVNSYRKRYSASGRSLLISGRDENKRRTRLFIADGEKGTLEQVDISSVTEEGGELAFAFYDDINGRIVMRIKGSESNLIYLIDTGTFDITRLTEYEEDTVVLALNGGALYFSLASEGGIRVCKYGINDGSVETAYEFDASVSFDRSADLRNFTVNAEDGKTSRVFVSETETLTEPMETANAATFVPGNGGILTDGESYYIITDGKSLSKITAGEAAALSVRDASSLFSIYEITPERLKIQVKNPSCRDAAETN